MSGGGDSVVHDVGVGGAIITVLPWAPDCCLVGRYTVG